MRLVSFIQGLLSHQKRSSKAPPAPTRNHPELSSPPHTLDDLAGLTAVPGWDTYDAPAIPARRWLEVASLVEALASSSAVRPLVHPSGDGAIRVSWEFPFEAPVWQRCEAELDFLGRYSWTDLNVDGAFTKEEPTLAHLIATGRRRLAQQAPRGVD